MVEEKEARKIHLTPHAFGMIGLLAVEFLLGMLTNLFVAFPQREYGDILWEFAKTQWLLMTHIVVGLLLLLGTIALVVRAVRMGNVVWVKASSLALIAIVGAIVAGSAFVPSQMNGYSFLMACFFIVALLSYFWGIYANK